MALTLTIDNVTKTILAWSKESHVGYSTIVRRKVSGWSDRDCVFKPRLKCNANSPWKESNHFMFNRR